MTLFLEEIFVLFKSRTPKRLAKERRLDLEEIALLDLYQRQDSLSTQLWQQFLLANLGVIAVVVLIAIFFNASVAIKWVLGFCVFLVWATFTIGGVSALRNVQDILLSLAYQIDGDVGDKTDLFTGVTRSKRGLTVFHVFVDIGVLGLSWFLLASDFASKVAK
jgi:hypothetical protein